MSGASEMHKQPTAEECRGVFRALFEQTSVGVVQVASRTGAFVRINKRFAEIFGYTVAEMERLTLQQITFPEDLLHEQANLQRLLAGEIRGFSVANRYCHKDGRTVWGELTVSPMWDVGEEPSFHIAMVEDITRRKLAEEAQQQREQTYRALVEGLPDIVLQYDREGRHLFVSENVEEVVDFPASQFLGKTTRELGFPEDLCNFWEHAIKRVFESGLPYETEFAFESKTGPQTRNWRLEPEFDKHGSVRSVLSISRDVTEYRRAEKDYETLFREMLNGFALHEIICNEQGEPVDYRFLAVNPAFERLTGLKSEDLVGKTVLEVMPSTERHWIELYGHVALEGEPVRFDNYSHTLEKHYTVTAFQPSPGQFACIFDDITDRKLAAEQLQASTERLRYALRAANMGTWEWDILANRVAWSSETLDIFGVSETDFGGTYEAYLDFAAPEVRQEVDQGVTDFLTQFHETSDIHYDHAIVRGDGTRAWVEVRGTLFLNEDGQPSRMTGVCMDITARRHAEEAMRETQERYRLAQHLSGVGTWEWTIATGKVFWSDEVLAMWGVERADFSGTYDEVAKRIHPDDFERWQENVHACVAGSQEHNIEYRVVRPDGAVRWVATYGDAERGADGTAIRLMGVIMDVTDRKLTEDALRGSEEQLRTVVQTMPVMIDAFDAKQNVIVWNRECERVTGYTAAEIVGNRLAMEMLYPDLNYREWIMSTIRKERGDFRNLEFTLTCKNGETRTVLWSNLSASHPIAGWGTWAVGLDITDRKRAERERDELIAMLEAQNAELERFTYTVSHDLKSPLITIKGYIGMLFEDFQEMDATSVKSDLSRISNAADKMGNLLEDLLELSRIGRLANPPENVSLAELADETLELLQGQLKAKRVKVEVSRDLPVVYGDRTRISEVLQNLVDNAVKYMGTEGEPRIEIGSRRDGDETVCFVRDNGIGIEKRFQEKVFGLFDQLDPKVEGTGIGLALVKRIVEVHGGRLWVESEGKGHGSTFCFTIPTEAAAPEREQAPRTTEPGH